MPAIYPTAGSTWSDKSGNANHATKTGTPTLVTNAQNGHSLMHYTANAQYHDFTKIDDIRTVFWVVSQDPSVNGSGYRFLLNSGGYGGVHPGADFHNDNNGQFWGNSAHANIKSGTTWMNGSQLSGNVNYPNNLSIISLKTAGNVAANRFGQDRTHGGRQWIGRLGEIDHFSTLPLPTARSKKWRATLPTSGDWQAPCPHPTPTSSLRPCRGQKTSTHTPPTFPIWCLATPTTTGWPRPIHEGTRLGGPNGILCIQSKIDMSSGSLSLQHQWPHPIVVRIGWNRWKWSSPDPFLDGCPIQHHSIQSGQVLL